MSQDHSHTAPLGVSAQGASSAQPSSMPLQPTSFIGRGSEIAAVTDLLAGARLVTLTGPGGTGKTRLALAVGERVQAHYADGVVFVDLASVGDPVLVLPAVAQALGLTAAQAGAQSLVGGSAGGRPLPEQLREFLRARSMLLLLDNMEHVVAAAPQLAELVLTCPHLTLLVTSRTALRVRGEKHFAVPPMALPAVARQSADQATTQDSGLRTQDLDAVRLFVERAREVAPHFILTEENAAVVTAICARLDGLPLAIELAAARITLLSPGSLLDRLEHRLTLLTGGGRDLPARQQTLRDTLAWSHDLLSLDEQRLFRRLAVFAGGCTVVAAEAVCNADAGLGIDALDGVASLAEKSLLRLLPADPDADGEPRLTMLETIREFALEQLTASGESEPLRRQHLRYLVAVAEEAEPALWSEQRDRRLRRLEPELDNLRAALDWAVQHGEAELGMRLVGSLFWLWWLRGMWPEARRWAEALLQLPEDAAPVAAQARVLFVLAVALSQDGDYTQAYARIEESIARWRQVDDRRWLARSLLWLTIVAVFVPGADERVARDALHESRALFAGLGNRWEQALVEWHAGWMAHMQGDPASARAPLERSLALFRELDDTWNIGLALYILGAVAFVTGDGHAARTLMAEAADAMGAAGAAHHRALALDWLARITFSLGDDTEAAAIFAESLAFSRRSGNPHRLVESLTVRATALIQRGDVQGAAPLLHEAITTSHRHDDKAYIAASLWCIAVLAQSLDQSAAVARLLGADEALREVSGFGLPASYRALHDATVTAARAALGDDAFTAAWQEGRALSLDDAVALALEQTTLTPPASPAAAASRPSPLPDGLTRREAEIVRLIAAGHSNREIADVLVLSVRTVERHVENIYVKLKVHGPAARAAVATYAAQRGLLPGV